MPLFHIHVLILEDQRQGMKISVQFRTMHRQWRQRGEISRSSCSLAHCLIRLIIRVVTTPRRRPGILQHEETFRETFHLFEFIENNNLNIQFNISSKSLIRQLIRYKMFQIFLEYFNVKLFYYRDYKIKKRSEN